MTQEQYILASQPNPLQRPGCATVYPVGIYGWRKRCLYFFILLLLVTMIVNLALTIWILKVMNFTVDSPLVLQSDRNVTVNARNNLGQLTGQLTVGSEMVEAQCQRFEVKSSDGERVLFSADEEEISIGTDKLRVTGNEGVVFSHSVETPHVRAEPFQDLKLESPTRTLTLEAPKGVEVNAGVGEFKASCRKDLTLESSEGEVSTVYENVLYIGKSIETESESDYLCESVCLSKVFGSNISSNSESCMFIFSTNSAIVTSLVRKSCSF
uniref:Sarcoglycan zeta n=1 Tax=Sinocyclocheilus rhinocerous TaxID=307959 RepID=A0A673IAK3_9TELE